ncbi:hypothetical protein BJX76DRAFT_324443 [Aspergillus varians]
MSYMLLLKRTRVYSERDSFWRRLADFTPPRVQPMDYLEEINLLFAADSPSRRPRAWTTESNF